VLREDRGPIAILTLNRPAQRNSLSQELMAEFQRQITDLSQSAAVKSIIVAASGPVFCAGHDIRELESHRVDADGGEAFFSKMFGSGSEMMQGIVRCPKPVIAAVQGTATAAGCQLVATCDLAVASEDSQFCTPGVHIGLFCSTPAVAVARNIGRKRAMEMLLLGEMIGAKEALAYGLVNRVVPQDEVMARAMELAGTIASKSAAANALGKKAFYEQIDAPLGAAYEQAGRTMVENMMLDDAREGLGAFLEKRKPRWRDI
jgi:enoyl-CoA hydratase/carnithine racemase